MLSERYIDHYVTYCARVYFQPNAWADELFMFDWLEQFVNDTASLPEEKLLAADGHGAQKTPEFRRRVKAANTRMVYTPPDCTDCVSPCDHHVGALLKYYISQYYTMDFEQNHEAWCNTATGLEAYERRIRIAVWTAAAWARLRVNSEFLRKAFVSTGFLIAKDGSEDNLIKIKGVDNYNYKI